MIDEISNKKLAAGRAVLVSAAKFASAMLAEYQGPPDLAKLGIMAGTGKFSITVSDALSPKPGVRLSWTSPTGDTAILGALEFTFERGSFIPAGRPN